MKDMGQMNGKTERQMGKPVTWFLTYYPSWMRRVSMVDEEARQMVYGFKDGRTIETELVARETARRLRTQYGSSCSEIVLSCVPASSSARNERRYREFCRRVSELTGCINGFDHVRVRNSRPTLHGNRPQEEEILGLCNLEFDEEWFRGRRVVCFDDVLTKGNTYARYAEQLETIGADVLGGLFLARTYKRKERV